MVTHSQSSRDMQFLCLVVKLSRWGTSMTRGCGRVRKVETLETILLHHLLLHSKCLHEPFATRTLMAYSFKVPQGNVIKPRFQP